MFEELPFILGFMVFSIVVSYLILHYIPEPYIKIFIGIMIVGVVIHELFHYLMCLITNTPVDKVNLLDKIRREHGSGYTKYEVGGSVLVKSEEDVSFLQAVLVSFAPLVFSFWIFFLLLNQVIHPTNEILFFISLFIVLSIIFSAAPSSADLLCVPRAFRVNPKYSTYQIFLLCLSILMVWWIAPFFGSATPHEAIIYLLIGAFYYLWKYGFKLINFIIQSAIPNKNFKKYSRGE